jgi:hypothetical protein
MAIGLAIAGASAIFGAGMSIDAAKRAKSAARKQKKAIRRSLKVRRIERMRELNRTLSSQKVAFLSQGRALTGSAAIAMSDTVDAAMLDDRIDQQQAQAGILEARTKSKNATAQAVASTASSIFSFANAVNQSRTGD